MRVSNYLIRMYEPEDWLRTVDEGTQVVNDFVFPMGPHEKNEFSDTIYHVNAEVPYHEHRKGHETFFVPKGRVECVVRGKRFVMEAGDILHLPPYVAHGFKHLEEGTVWRELFHELDMAQRIVNKNRIKNNYGDLYDDPEFQTIYQGDYNRIMRTAPIPEDVDKREMWEMRTPGFSYNTFTRDGLILKLVVGRWELGGIKEIWEAGLDKGVYAKWEYPHPEHELYYITKGRFRFKVMSDEFEAYPDCLVSIPPYSLFELEALEDGSKLYDCGGSARLLDLLEDLGAYEIREPEKLKDKSFVKQLLRHTDCWVTGFGRK